MPTIEDRLRELGLALPAPLLLPPGATLPFPWVRIHGTRAFISGHGPQNPDGSLARPLGKVGAEVSVEQAYAAARLVGLSILASLKRELGDLDRVSEGRPFHTFRRRQSVYFWLVPGRCHLLAGLMDRYAEKQCSTRRLLTRARSRPRATWRRPAPPRRSAGHRPRSQAIPRQPSTRRRSGAWSIARAAGSYGVTCSGSISSTGSRKSVSRRTSRRSGCGSISS